jgi:hypothetical protein
VEISREIVMKPPDAGAHFIPIYAQSRDGSPAGPAAPVGLSLALIGNASAHELRGEGVNSEPRRFR